MFIGLIEFNRLLNIRSYIRKVGGKMVRVKSHKKQAVLRAHDAAEDLLKQLNSDSKEFGYIISKSGKVSKLYKGSSGSIELPSGKGGKLYIHNHPRSGSMTPSYEDLIGTSKSNQGSLITRDLKSRFYLTKPLPRSLYKREIQETRTLLSLFGNFDEDTSHLIYYQAHPNIFFRSYNLTKTYPKETNYIRKYLTRSLTKEDKETIVNLAKAKVERINPKYQKYLVSKEEDYLTLIKNIG